MLKSLVENKYFTNSIIVLIILNGITMGMATSQSIMSSSIGKFIQMFDVFVITIFTIEVTLRIIVYKKEFFKDSWSLFDFFVVAISLVPSSNGLEILRILRVLRLFRLITVVPSMRKIVGALLSVIPGMLSVAALLLLIFYVFAIMGTQLYSQTFPQWFGTLGESFYTLFQIMTLESWSMGIVRPIMEVHPYAYLFFVPFIFIATFVVINLIIAIVVDAMTELKNEEEETIVKNINNSNQIRSDEINELKEEIKQLKQLILEQNKS